MQQLLRGCIMLLASLPVFGSEALRFGVHPFMDALELRQRFTPLVRHLAAQLQLPVELYISPDYQSHIDAMGRGKLDIALLGPAPYCELTQRYGDFPLLARYEVDGEGAYHGVVVVREESDLRGLAGLRGRRFAFGDRHSTMSHLVPLFMLRQAGVREAELAGYEFLNNHENVALGVLSGRFDAGAMMEAVYRQYRDLGLRVLARSPPITEHLFVAGSGTDPPRVDAIRRALLALAEDPAGGEILHGIKGSLTGLLPVEDRDYDNLREILRSVRD